MNPTDTSRCPLCGGANDCQLCTPNAYKGPCWCAQMEIPEALLAQVPADLRNKTCICRDCVVKSHRTKANGGASQRLLPGDFCFDAGRLVFTADYHLRRGYCCGNNCRHCPYPKPLLVTTA